MELFVFWDDFRFVEVVINLLMNTILFMQRDRTTLAVLLLLTTHVSSHGTLNLPESRNGAQAGLGLLQGGRTQPYSVAYWFSDLTYMNVRLSTYACVRACVRDSKIHAARSYVYALRRLLSFPDARVDHNAFLSLYIYIYIFKRGALLSLTMIARCSQHVRSARRRGAPSRV